MNVIATFAERDHIIGASVLYNSLLKNGFTGKFVIGVRNLEEFPKRIYEKYKELKLMDLDVEFRCIDTDLHFANYKPRFMLDLIDEFSELDKIIYIDPDIVVNCPFSWMSTWADHGPVLCADVNSSMPTHHPTRYEWMSKIGFSAVRSLDAYFNSGFLALSRKDREFAVLWDALIRQYGSCDNPVDGKGDIGNWRVGGRWKPFFSPNQDTLNVAAMMWEREIVTLGPDAMGFIDGITLIPHAIGKDKPWRCNYIIKSIKGYRPRRVDKLFWEYSSSPIDFIGNCKCNQKRLELKISSLIARFISAG